MSLNDLTKDINDRWRSHWDTIINKSVKRGLRPVLVEGDDDKIVVEHLLEAVAPLEWEERVVVGAAGDRTKVLRRLEANPDWYGLIDRDVWDDTQVVAVKQRLQNLEVTSGWCIENHLCLPAEVESALSLTAGSIETDISRTLDGWVCHGAIWWTLQRMRDYFASALPSSEFGHPMKDPCDPIRDEAALRSRLEVLRESLGAMEIESVIGRIHDRLQAVNALPPQDRLERGIHGKLFFREAVARALSQAVRQQDANRWRAEVAGKWKTRWPDYLVTFVKRLLQ